MSSQQEILEVYVTERDFLRPVQPLDFEDLLLCADCGRYRNADRARCPDCLRDVSESVRKHALRGRNARDKFRRENRIVRTGRTWGYR